MSQTAPDHWQAILVLGAVALVLFSAWRGWRLGIVRQVLSIVALVVAYAAGWLLGGFLIPVLRPLGFPDSVLTLIGGGVIGLVVYVAFAIVCGVLFKRTAQQSVGLVRWGFGLAGAVLGAGFGAFLVLVCAVAIRVLGSIDGGTHELSAVKRSLEKGPAGVAMRAVDPVPEPVYETLGKVGRLASSPAGIERFSSDRDVRRVSAHPKILALRDDAEVWRALRDGDYLSLLRNPKLVEAANDPEVARLLGGLDLRKALDSALVDGRHRTVPNSR